MADTRYDSAYRSFLESGNLADAARSGGVNSNSLRDYARRHDWRGDREVHLARLREREAAVSAGTDRLVTEFYSRPSGKSAQLARQGLDLRAAVDSAALEDGAARYDGSRDTFRELTVACLMDARRRGDMKTVRECLSLLADADGHTAAPKTAPKADSDKTSGPNWAAIKDLLDPAGEVFTGPGESVQTG